MRSIFGRIVFLILFSRYSSIRTRSFGRCSLWDIPAMVTSRRALAFLILSSFDGSGGFVGAGFSDGFGEEIGFSEADDPLGGVGVTVDVASLMNVSDGGVGGTSCPSFFCWSLVLLHFHLIDRADRTCAA